MLCTRQINSLISRLLRRGTRSKLTIFMLLQLLITFWMLLRRKPLIKKPHVEEIISPYAKSSDIPNAKVPNIDCLDLFHGMHLTQYEDVDNDDWHLPDEYYLTNISDCESFINDRRYIMKPVSAEEESFPLAFSLLVYKDVHQIEQLLRAIYRPQNYYCIHVDKKANSSVYDALSLITACFNNVFLSSTRLTVKWGEFSVLEPELNCMQELWNKTDWKYFINLTGQEFPLKTILDMVRILKTYKGANAIDIHPGNRAKRYFQFRVEYHYPELDVTTAPKPPPPHNMSYTFGPVHVAVTRSFVDFVLHNQVALDFRDWVRDTNVPDETFYTSLQINPQVGVPGAFTGDPSSLIQSYNPFIRYKLWHHCGPRGRMVRNICILGVHNVYDLGLSHHMFANKFFSHHQPVARMCLEERLFNRTRDQTWGGARLDLSPYKGVIFINHHTPS